MVIGLITNLLAQVIVRVFDPLKGSPLMSAVTPAVSLKPSGGLRRRLIVNKLMEILGWAAALVAVAVLFLVIISVAVRAWPALSWDFLTKPPALFGQPGGGISSAIVGSAIIVAIATAIALPVGRLIGIYLTEFAPRSIAQPVQLVLDILNGLPTIVTGIFVYGLLVIGMGRARTPPRSPSRSSCSRSSREPRRRRCCSCRLLCAKGSLAPRGQPLAQRDRRDPADDARRHSHGAVLAGRTRGRRDRAAPLHLLDLQHRGVDRRHEGDAEYPRLDLHVLGAARQSAPRAGLGRRRSY
jgi:hypothetical protein